MMYGMMQYSGVHGQQNLDFYYSGMPLPGASMLPMHLSHGACDHFPHSNSYVGSFVVDSESGRSRQVVEDIRGPYKRKVEGNAVGAFQYYNASASSSSSVAPQHPRHPDGMAMMDTSSFPMPQYRGSSTVPPLERGPHTNIWARPGDPLILPENNHLIHGNYLGQCLHPTAGPWFEQQLSSHTDLDGRHASWNHFPGPFMQASNPNRSPLEGGNVGLQRYHETTINDGGPRFLTPPPPPSVNPNFHHGYHMHVGRVPNMNFHPQVISPLYGNPTYAGTVIPAQSGFEMGAPQLRPVPSAGIRLFHPQTNGAVPETTVRPHNVAHLRLLPSDEVAILELHDSDEDSELVDHHSDMRLDIDHMSYEELLALGEWIGNVNTGMPEKAILSRLKTKTYLAPTATAMINLEEAASDDQEPDSCIICQEEYRSGEKIGVLECSHQYHVSCLKKWLHVKNVCPICKSEALASGKKEEEV